MSKTFKKFMLIIIVTLAFLLLPQSSVNATTIDSSESLKEAFESKSASIEGTTITLKGNVEFKNPEWTENSTDKYYDVIELGGDDYILNLNGYSFNVDELNLNDGSLTINDNWMGSGTFWCHSEYSGINIFSDAELVVNRGNIEAVIINQGTLNINDGIFRKFIQNTFHYENDVLNSLGKLNIEKGEFSGIGQEGIATVNGGIFRNSDNYSAFTILSFDDNKGSKTTIKGGEFICSNPEEFEAIAIFNNESSLKEDEINKYILDGHVATYDKATIVDSGASPYVSYNPRVKVSSQKILDFLDKIAPNEVWTVNSYRPTEHIEGLTVLTAALKEALEKEGIDYSKLDVYASFDASPEEGIIEIGYRNGTREIREVKVVYNEPDKESDNEPNEIINKFLAKNDKLNMEFNALNEKTAYRVEDLYLINYFYNAKKGIDNSLALNFSKELIEDANGSNIYFRFYGGFGEGDSTELYSFEGGQGAVFHKGTIYASINSGVTLNHVLYIPADTFESTDAYIDAAMKRIKDYLGTTDGIKIEVGNTFESLIDHEAGMTHWNTNGFVDETTCGSYYYNITINEKTYRFSICKKDAKDLEIPKYLASDIMSSICIKSNSTEIPLDTAISAEKTTSDEIEKTLGTKVYVAFNISLYSNAKRDQITKLDNGEFLVSIPVPEILKDKKITVYYIDSNGNKTLHDATVEDGFAIFKTNHFSTYVLTEKIKETYKVVFDANEGSFKGGKTLTIDKWENGMEEKLEIPTRKGYKFLGFFTEKKGGTKLENYIAEAGIDGNLTFYAQWEEISSEAELPISEDNYDSNNNDKPTGVNPQTGDNIIFFIGMLVIAVIGIIVTTIYGKYYKTK